MDQLYKVLLVDDEYLIRKLIRMSLDWESLGMEVVGEAGNAKEAMDLCMQLKPDIILTDICMPSKDGIDFAREVMEIFPSIHVAVITAHDDFNYAQRSINAGISGYILKPIKVEDLIEVTDRIKTSIERDRSAEYPLGKALQNHPGNPIIVAAMEMIQNGISDENLNIGKVASSLFVSPGHLGRLFKSEINMTFLEYLTELRLELAKQLLRDTQLHAYEVAEKVGIGNPHYFGLLFKKNTGITISEFRKGMFI